jgi:hypothetical protein
MLKLASPPTRGVLYIVWGEKAEDALSNSIEALKETNPDLPHKIIRVGEGGRLLDKSKMFHWSPFDTTLYLDADTQVLSDLSFGFDMAERHGLALCINECPWARRYKPLGGDDIEYNTGVMFFSREAENIFRHWEELAYEIDSSIDFQSNGQDFRMPENDQASVAMAIKQAGINPFVLPMNWNFRPMFHKSWFGNIKVWHSYEPIDKAIMDFSERQKDERVILFAQALSQNKPVIPPTVAIQSLGRLTFSRNALGNHNALTALGIPLDSGIGVYYHIMMCQKMQQWADKGMKYILTVDNDSYYRAEDVMQLITLAEANPDAAAICALQIKRDSEVMLGTVAGEDGKAIDGKIDMSGALTPIMTGHFGLTIIRVEALLKMPKPWMHFKPSEDGSWDEGRIDADVWFWNQLQASGQKAYMAHNVRIGHGQEMIMVPSHDGTVKYITVNEYDRNGLPAS